jgi:hypothetical protein
MYEVGLALVQRRHLLVEIRCVDVDIDGARQMAGGKLAGRPHVQHAVLLVFAQLIEFLSIHILKTFGRRHRLAPRGGTRRFCSDQRPSCQAESEAKQLPSLRQIYRHR